MNTKDVRDYFCRHFLGLVKVNSVPAALAGPQVFSQKRDIEVHLAQIEAQINVTGADLLPDSGGRVKVMSADLLSSGGISCSSMGFQLTSKPVEVNEVKIKKYAPDEIVWRSFSKLKVKTRLGTKQMAVLPQERTNRLQWQLVRPKKENEVILAWFGPIIEDAVAKLTLNKQQGTLLIWYNPQSRHFDAKGLYLCRRMGLKENLEWRWV